MKKKLVTGLATCLLMLGMTGMAKATTIVYSDSFEGGSINPFWTLTEQFGNAELSSDQAVSGNQSLKLSSFDGGQKNIFATHYFSESMRGTIAVWFYDSTVGQNAIGSQLETVDRTTLPATTNYLGVVDYNQTTYYTGDEDSSYGRSLGWHRFEVNIDENGTRNYIDGSLVHSTAQFNQVDSISLYAQVPWWRPNATYYFDDFQVNLSSVNTNPVPEPATMLLFGTGLAGLAGARLRRKKK